MSFTKSFWFQNIFLTEIQTTVDYGQFEFELDRSLVPALLCSDVQQVLPRPYSLSVRFKLRWRGQTFAVPGVS